MEKESYYHSWNGLFLGQIYSKGVTRTDAERLELYFEDSTGEVKRVDSIGFVTDAECNITGIVFKNDPKKYGKSKKKIVAKEEKHNDEKNVPDESETEAETEQDKPVAKKTKAATAKKTTTKRAKKTKESKDEK